MKVWRVIYTNAVSILIIWCKCWKISFLSCGITAGLIDNDVIRRFNCVILILILISEGSIWWDWQSGCEFHIIVSVNNHSVTQHKAHGVLNAFKSSDWLRWHVLAISLCSICCFNMIIVKWSYHLRGILSRHVH